MVQKFNHLLLGSDRKVQCCAGMFVAAVAFIVVSGPRREPHVPKQSGSTSSTFGSHAESYSDLVGAIGSKVDAIDARLRALDEYAARLDRRQEETEARFATIAQHLLSAINEFRKSQPEYVPASEVVPEARSDDPNYQDSPRPSYPDAMRIFGTIDEPRPASEATTDTPSVAIITPGSSVRVRLLSGLSTRTDGTPAPALFEVSGSVRGARGTELPIEGARLMTAATGSFEDGRVLFRLVTLTVGLPDGTQLVRKVDGWIVGEDGITGVAGTVIDPLAKLVGSAAVAGGVDAVGRTAIRTASRNNDSELLVPAESVAGGSSVLSDIMTERARSLVPRVQVNSSRYATAVFSQPAELEGLFESLVGERNSTVG